VSTHTACFCVAVTATVRARRAFVFVVLSRAVDRVDRASVVDRASSASSRIAAARSRARASRSRRFASSVRAPFARGLGAAEVRPRAQRARVHGRRRSARCAIDR